MIKRLIVLIVLIVVAAAGLPIRSAQALQSSPGPMERMLAQVGDNQISRTVIMYGSLSDLEKLLGFLLHGGAERAVELGVALGIGLVFIEVAELEPLAGEVGDEGLGLRVGHHALDLGLEHAGLAELAGCGAGG